MKPFIIREEYFGGTMLRRKDLTFSFLNEWQTDILRFAAIYPPKEASMEHFNKYVPKEFSLSSEFTHAQIYNYNLFMKEKTAAGLFNTDGTPNYEFRHSEEDVSKLPRGVLKSPLRLYFEITRKCNLNCKNCFSSSGKSYDNELTHEEVKTILSELRKSDVLEARITGGEPTQRERWDEIVAHARDIGLAVSLNTNGIYSHPSVRDKIADLGIDQVIISLDGNKEAHESLRGKGTYDKTLETIKYLSNKSNNVRVNTILKEESIPFIPQMIDMAHAYNTEMCFILLRPVGRGAELFDAIPSAKKLYDGVLKVKELRAKYPDTKIMTSYDVIQSGANKPAPDLDLTGCAAGLRGVGISSRGRIECCGFLAEITEEYTPGNIRDHDYSLTKVWRESPEIKKFRQMNLDRNKKCVSCDDYKNNCFGTCVVMEIYKDHNPLKKDPYCYQDMHI